MTCELSPKLQTNSGKRKNSGLLFRVKHPYQEIRDTTTYDDNQLRRISSKISICVLLSSTFRRCGQKMRTALRFRGKRPSRPSIFATAAGKTNSLLFLVDGHSAKRFLVYTGAAVSVYPASLRDTNGGSHSRSLVAANGSNIVMYGTRRMNIRLENQDYTWPFILADVKTPLLGADFLQANGLLVDLQSKRLVIAASFASSTLRQSNQTSLGLHHVTSNDPYRTHVYLNSSTRSPVLNFQASLSGMAWNISSKQKVHQCTLELADCHQTNLSLPKRSLEICKIWGSHEGQTVRGRLPCTWCRRTPAVGDRVTTTYVSMTSRRPTAIRCHTSRTLPRNSRELRFSLRSTWYVATTRFR